MSENTTSGEASGGADPDTFNFDDYISGISTFPEFRHTVYLDQRSGIELHELSQEYDKLADRGREIMRIQSSMGESSTRSFVDEEADELSAELTAIEQQTTELAPRIHALDAKIRKSALILTFQAGTAQKLGQVLRRAERDFHKKHGRKDDTDVEYVTARSKAILSAQLNAYCTGLILADGREQDPPSADGFMKLLDSLISSESVRLMTTLNKSLDASTDWADRVDAGFPGGRDEQAGGSVGRDGAEDGPFLDLASFDAIERGGS